MIQNVLCFLPKADKSDGKVQSSISSEGESGRKSYSGRRRIQQPLENEGGEQDQQYHENYGDAVEEAPRRSICLMDQILSASRRFTNSVNFMHRTGESIDKHEIEANNGTAPVLNAGQTKPQAAKLITRRSASEDTYDKMQLHNTSGSVPFLLCRSDERNSERIVSPGPSPELLEPVEEAGRNNLQYTNRVIPEKFNARKTTSNHSDISLRQQSSPPPRFLPNDQSYKDSEFSFQADSLPIPGPKATTLQNVLGLENHSSLPMLEQEKADEYRVMQMILPSVPPSEPNTVSQEKPGNMNHRSPLAIEDERETEEDSKDEERDRIVRLGPTSQPVLSQQTNTRLVENGSSSPTTPEQNDEINACNDDRDGMLTKSLPNSPLAILQTKLAINVANYNCNVSTMTEKSGDDGIISPSDPDENLHYQHDEVSYESFRTPSSLEDNKTMAHLLEELNHSSLKSPPLAPSTQRQPPVVEEKPSAAPVPAANSSIPARRRRKVRFSGFDATSLDLSETLLGKLSATKHQQVKYLQEELEQTRAQVAELEVDCEAQRDLKLAFKLQAVRLGAALKKLRELSQENGLEPCEAKSGKRLAPSSMVNAQIKGSKDTYDEQGSKEKGSSQELNRLKALRAQAKQFGWVCDPKEVELGEQIGSGSVANIFKGVWHNLDVAVKCWRLDTFGGNMDAIGAFCQEVELVSRLRHPYILQMFAACLSPPDHPWIITEYLSSGTLTEWLHGTKTPERNRSTPLPPMLERLRIATEISMGMQYLHELSPKVLHRDLKPSNILLDERNHVRISDFSCACYFNSKSDTFLTGETGTYMYMAPEVMAHESYDEKCDIYSFAVILCELVTGNPPYMDTHYSPGEIACKVSQGTLRPTLPESEPLALLHLIKSAWMQESAERPSFSKITATLQTISKNVKVSRSATS